jgi:hypothetical protein
MHLQDVNPLLQENAIKRINQRDREAGQALAESVSTMLF